jgi:hypothetical protein
MNIQAILEKMNAYFKNVHPDELISEFEKKGYVFEDVFDIDAPDISYTTYHSHLLGTNGVFTISKAKKSKINSCFFFAPIFNRFTSCK